MSIIFLTRYILYHISAICIPLWRLGLLVITSLKPFNLFDPSSQISQKALLLRLYGTYKKHLFHAQTTFLIQETILSGQVIKPFYCDLRVVINLFINLFYFLWFCLAKSHQQMVNLSPKLLTSTLLYMLFL